MRPSREKEYFTIEKEVRKEFLDHIHRMNLNKSRLIQYLIQEYLKGEKCE